MESSIQIYHIRGKKYRINKNIFKSISQYYKLDIHNIKISDLVKIGDRKVHIIIFDDISIDEIKYSDIEYIQENNKHLYTVFATMDINAKLATQVYEEHIDYIINSEYDDHYVKSALKTILKRKSLKYQLNLKLMYKNVVVDRILREVFVNNHIIDTTAKEYKIIRLLLSKPTIFFSKENIFREIWGYDEDTTRVLDQYIHRIKKKFSGILEVEYEKTKGIRII